MDTKQIEKSFLKLYDESADTLLRHCYFRVHDRELAKDLTQEAFTRMWQYLAAGKEVENMNAFLYRMANNLVIDHYRRKKSASLEALQEGGFDPSGSEHEHVMDRAQIREALEAVDTLEEPYLSVIRMRYVSDLTISEIAEATGESDNVVSVQIHRGIKKLRTLLHL